MPKANDYKLSDIPVIDIPKKVLLYAEKVSEHLKKENKGQKTMLGGDFRDIKGTVGQWAVHKYLLNEGWKHTFSKPYVKGQCGDQYDIIFGDEDIWEVKCRSWWKEKYFYNIRLLMGEHEYENSKTKRCDYYIFTTTNKDYTKAYILGGIGGYELWNDLEDLTGEEEQYMKYPTRGKIYSRQLTPIRNLILRT